MKVKIREDDEARRKRLADIYDHVGEISNKIVSMDDPLPGQLERSIPNFQETLTCHANKLKHSTCSVAIAGESCGDKNFVINSLLGIELLPVQTNKQTASVCEISYDTSSWCQIHYWSVNGESVEPIILKDHNGFGEEVAGFVQAMEDEVSAWPYKKAEIFTISDTLEDGLVLVDIPCVGVTDPINNVVMDQIANCVALIYVINCTQNNDFEVNKLQKLVNAISSRSPQKQPFLTAASIMFVFLCAQQDYQDYGTRQRHLRHLQDLWPGCENSLSVFLPMVGPFVQPPTTTDDLTVVGPSYGELEKLAQGIERLGAVHLSGRLHLAYTWLHSFVGRVLHHLRAFLSQAEKSQEERTQTFAEINLRLQQLTSQADQFFVKLRKEVDGKVDEAVVQLRNHLQSEDVLQSMSCWDEFELPTQHIWNEVDTAIREKISRKLYYELARWEEENRFFQNLRPYLIEHFQQQFAGIEKQLTMVETMIARHDSRYCLDLLDIDDNEKIEHAEEEDNDQSVGYLPYNLHLNLGQKIALGVAAPILVPIALTLAVLGLPIIGGIAAKDLIAEKLAENRLKDYNTDRMKYLKRRTPEDIKKFAKSKALVKYVKNQLEPAYRCISQLEEVVPGQIDADMCQVESLRNDARESKDVSRFYQPLVQVFEYDKQMLMLYRVMYMQRDKLDYKYNDVVKPQSVRTICEGLAAVLQGDFWVDDVRGKGKRVVSLRQPRKPIEPNMVNDYLQEEEAYRFQACPHIVKFYGVTKALGQLFQIVEPLSCSLRHLLSNASENGPDVSDKSRFNFLKTKMVEAVKGLEYLHSRGWVHYDLSLDTVAVDAGASVKLTNISMRRMVEVDRAMSHSEISTYAHLPHEVLVHHPAAYTATSEMYCVGIMMWEMWTRSFAYRQEIYDTEEPLDTLDKFVVYIDSGRPKLDAFYTHNGEITSQYAEMWQARMRQCWTEAERITSKAWLQLTDEATNRLDALPILEGHFAS